MSIFASILRSVYKLSGAKKAFALPEDALRKEIEKQNRHRGVFTPTDHKAYYETIAATTTRSPSRCRSRPVGGWAALPPHIGIQIQNLSSQTLFLI